MFKKSILVFSVAIAAGLLMTSCKGSKGNSNKVYKDQVVIHGLSDAKGLNPITTSDAYANQYIVPNIFQTLLAYDHQTMEILPVLAKSRPVIRLNGDIAELDFELRPEAAWDNGAPITVDDILFSFKTAFCPNINNDNIKPGVDFIKDIKTYPDNNRKLTVICNKYIGMEDGVGTTIAI
ncbi:MAG TPA: hypothetical protein PLK15_08545, partial [Chitinophagales bacterium]|nr:hypothetical protein [Chitinophagales bacterium]